MDYCLITITEHFAQRLDRYEFLTNFVWFLKSGKRDSCLGPLALDDTTYHKQTHLLTNTWVLSAGPKQLILLNIYPDGSHYPGPKEHFSVALLLLYVLGQQTVTKCHEGLGAVPLMTPEVGTAWKCGKYYVAGAF